MQAGQPLLASRKRAVSVRSPAGSKRRKVAAEAQNCHVLEAHCSTDIEDMACFNTSEIKQVLPVLLINAPCSQDTQYTAPAPAGSTLAHNQ